MPALRSSSSLFLDRRQLIQATCLSILSGLPAVEAANFRPNAKKRVVCIGGGLTEIVCALGCESHLVGVDTTSRFPVSIRRLPSVGYARSLSLEGVLALAPQNVIVGRDAGPASVLARLREAGVTVSSADDGYTIEALLLRVTQLGRVLKREEKAQALTEQLWREWTAVISMVPVAESGIRVMFILGLAPGQVIVAGSGTGADVMLKYAGLQNAFSDTNGYRPITTEALIAAQPDLIVLAQPDSTTQEVARSTRESIKQIQGLSATPAAQPARWLVFDTMFLLSFGPRMPDAILTLHRTSLEALRA
jgi:iron complex transport system substrate-binding protein